MLATGHVVARLPRAGEIERGARLRARKGGIMAMAKLLRARSRIGAVLGRMSFISLRAASQPKAEDKTSGAEESEARANADHS